MRFPKRKSETRSTALRPPGLFRERLLLLAGIFGSAESPFFNRNVGKVILFPFFAPDSRCFFRRRRVGGPFVLQGETSPWYQQCRRRVMPSNDTRMCTERAQALMMKALWPHGLSPPRTRKTCRHGNDTPTVTKKPRPGG